MSIGSFQTLWLIPAMLALSSCAHSSRTYQATDLFFKGEGFPVPREFRLGTARLADVCAWSSSLMGTRRPLQSLHLDIDFDGVPELFVSQPANAGTGGNSYLVFRENNRGFQYLGRLGFGAIRPMAADREGRIRVLSSGWMGGGECAVTVHVLATDGFREVASRVLPCGDSATDGEGGRLHKRLFDSAVPSRDALRAVFGVEL